MSLNVAIVYGLTFIIIAYYVFVKDLMNKPGDALNTRIWQYLRFKDLGVFFYILGGFFLVGYSGTLLTMSAGQAYETAVQSFFTALAWLVAGFFIAYASIYVIFRIKEELQGLADESGRLL